MFQKSGESGYKSNLQPDAPEDVLDDLFHKSFKSGYKSNLEFGSLKDQWSPGEIEAFKQMERDHLQEIKSVTPTSTGNSKVAGDDKSYLNNDERPEMLAFEKETKLLYDREMSRRLRELAESTVNINRSRRRKRKFME